MVNRSLDILFLLHYVKDKQTTDRQGTRARGERGRGEMGVMEKHVGIVQDIDVVGIGLVSVLHVLRHDVAPC